MWPGHWRNLCESVAGHTGSRTSQTPQHSEKSQGKKWRPWVQAPDPQGGHASSLPESLAGGPSPPAPPGPPQEKEEEEEKESDRKSEVSQQQKSSPFSAAPPSEEGPPQVIKAVGGPAILGPTRRAQPVGPTPPFVHPELYERFPGRDGTPELLLTIV